MFFYVLKRSDGYFLQGCFYDHSSSDPVQICITPIFDHASRFSTKLYALQIF